MVKESLLAAAISPPMSCCGGAKSVALASADWLTPRRVKPPPCPCEPCRAAFKEGRPLFAPFVAGVAFLPPFLLELLELAAVVEGAVGGAVGVFGFVSAGFSAGGAAAVGVPGVGAAGVAAFGWAISSRVWYFRSQTGLGASGAMPTSRVTVSKPSDSMEIVQVPSASSGKE